MTDKHCSVRKQTKSWPKEERQKGHTNTVQSEDRDKDDARKKRDRKNIRTLFSQKTYKAMVKRRKTEV